MAVTKRSTDLLKDLRAQVGDLADDAVRQIAQAWLAAWERLAPAWQAALAAVVEQAARSGRWPPSWQLARIPEVATAAVSTQHEAGLLVAGAVAATSAAALATIAVAVASEPAILAAQLPAGMFTAATAQYAAKVSPASLDPVRDQARRNAVAAAQVDPAKAVERTLVRAPRAQQSIPDMLAALDAAFNAGNTRAIAAARTAIMDAFRATSARVHAANADVLDGTWTWWATRGPRCCVACWSMHGTTHPHDQPGPLDHAQGRCARLARLKPWAQLGVATREPADAIPDAETSFRKLPRAAQLQVMGAARLQMLDDGEIRWADLAVRKAVRGWRDAYVPRTVAELKRIAGRRVR